MAGKNLFEDMGAEEMRQRLQVVSELMDEVINERRRQLRQQNMKRDDLLEDPMWNLAHDVLEIVHCLGRESSLAEVIEKCIDTKLKPIEEKLTKVEKLVVGYADGSAEEEVPLGAKFDKLIISDPQTGECTVWGALSTEDAPVPPSEDIAFDGSDLDGLSRRDTILRLVIVYGWNYGDAVDFAMNYQDSRG